MGTRSGNRGRTGARRVAVAGTADMPPQGEGMDALSNWLENSGFETDRAVISSAEDAALSDGAIDATGVPGLNERVWDDLSRADRQQYIRGALSAGGVASTIANPRNNAQFEGIDATTTQLSRAAMLPVARRERFYWQTAYTDAQVKPEGRIARQAVSRLRDIERTSGDTAVSNRARNVANRISQAYGLEGNPGVVGIKPGATGKGVFDLVTNPRLRKFNPDTIFS
jgi:hypothetical protein